MVSPTRPRCIFSYRMKLPKIQKDDLVVIYFLDHAEDGSAIEFRVAGWVDVITKSSIEILSWDYPVGSPWRDRDPEDRNLKRFSIVKAAITKLKIILEDVPPPMGPTPVAPGRK
jgi:hypothetical protein